MTNNLIHFADRLPGLPEELLLARDRGEVLFVTGSGISRPAPTNLPDFAGLVGEVYDALDPAVGAAFRAAVAYREGGQDPIGHLNDNPAAFGRLIAPQIAELKRCLTGEFDVVLGMLERRLDDLPGNNSAVREAARASLRVAVQPNRLHSALRTLGQRFNQPFLATTNYDLMLEAAKPRLLPANASYGLSSLPRPSRRPEFHGIFHIHGILPVKPTDRAEMILTDQDFGDFYLRRRVTTDFIYDAARIFHLVLIGYSLSDAPMRYLLNAIAGDETHFNDIKKRYAFIPVAGVNESTEADWRGRGITPIAYDKAGGHQQLCEVLEAWAASTPKPGNTDWTKKRLKEIARLPLSKTSSREQSVFRYLLRRSTATERMDLLAYLTKRNVPFDWLNVANEVIEGRA